MLSFKCFFSHKTVSFTISSIDIFGSHPSAFFAFVEFIISLSTSLNSSFFERILLFFYHIQYFLNHTVAGGTCINELMLTSVNPHLPFGGVNNSGVGKTGGKHSFMDFSNQRGIIRRKYGNSLKLIYPPFHKHIFRYFKRVIKL